MKRFLVPTLYICLMLIVFAPSLQAQSSCDPQSRVHVPIGIPNTLDALKTFVDGDGSFSPGFATYGIYFWLYDTDARKLLTPSSQGALLSQSFRAPGVLIPRVRMEASGWQLQTDICEFRAGATDSSGLVVATEVQVRNAGSQKRKVTLFAAIRPLGPAGGRINGASLGLQGRAIVLDGKPALIAGRKPTGAFVSSRDDVCQRLAAGGQVVPPAESGVSSDSGDCSAFMRFDMNLGGGKTEAFSFLAPVLPGRHAVRHQWDGKDPWAQLDDAVPGGSDGILQPDPSLESFGTLDVAKETDRLFTEATAYWNDFTGRMTAVLPDSRWTECLAAITGHLGLCLNEGAPDVAVVNYNVFNRDGAYTANVLQKSGHADLAAQVIDYFLKRPFNGRIYPEADNPGQILWLMGNHWLFTRDQEWLKKVYPSAKQLARMIQYYRTSPGPHFVAMDSLEYGEMLEPERRQELKPGRCDGEHPEYTEAFDIAGLRGAALLASASKKAEEYTEWVRISETLMGKYDTRFGRDLTKGYGRYSVLWPCRLYPFHYGKGSEQFRKIGPQKPESWRYFPLATAHQGLLAGVRESAHQTIEDYLNLDQMKGWYLLDEGGKSGAGGWRHARTNWDSSVAMPHGWAAAEMWLLLRDSLVFEESNRLILFAGIPAAWFKSPAGLSLTGFPTSFGTLSVSYQVEQGKVTVKLTGDAAPSSGIVIRLPQELKTTLVGKGEKGAEKIGSDIVFREGKKEIQFQIEG